MTKPFNMKKRKGVGGWLILVAIGVILSPFFSVINFMEYPPLILGEDFPYYTIQIKFYIWGEAVFFAVMTIFMTYVAYLFFKKKRVFPNWFIVGSLAYLVFALVDSMILNMLVPQEDPNELFAGIFRSAISAAIWIPYMLKSERVKLTFVEA